MPKAAAPIANLQHMGVLLGGVFGFQFTIELATPLGVATLVADDDEFHDADNVAMPRTRTQTKTENETEMETETEKEMEMENQSLRLRREQEKEQEKEKATELATSDE
ncbi:hypothetical protein ACLKA6_014231 [Drosophila palustris]